jgi:hypothetical protein
MPMGKHYGSFAKGFADSLIAMMRLKMMSDYYQSREAMNKSRIDLNAARAEFYRTKGMTGKDAQIEGWERTGRAGWHTGEGGGEYKEPAGDVAARAQDYSKFLQDQGYSKAGASAILGNWWQENNLKGGGFGGDQGTSAGGFQWHDMPGSMRGTEFMNWAKTNGLDVHDPMTSLRYVAYDLNTNPQWKALNSELKSTNDVDQATKNFSAVYEAPKPATANIPNRVGFARTVFGGAAPTTTSKPRTEKVSADEKPTHAGWENIVDKETPEGEQYKRDHPDWMKAYRAGKPPETGKTAQADQNVQVASLDDTAGLAEYLRLHPEAVRYQDLTEPGPPPKAAPPSDQPTYDPTTGEVIPPPEDPQGIRQRFVEQGMSGHPSQGETAYDPTTSRTRLYSAPDAYRPEDSPRPLPAGPQGPPQRPPGPMDPSIIARQRGIPPAPPPYGPQYTPPSVATTNLSERGTPYGSTGPMPARVASHPYPTPPESGFPPPAAAPMMPPRTTTPSTAYPPSTRQGPTLPSAADKPAPATQPVASPAGPAVTQPSNQFGGGRFTMVERPNIDVANPRSGGPPMMTALDLSHLWGPNPPLAQRAPQPVSGGGGAPTAANPNNPYWGPNSAGRSVAGGPLMPNDITGYKVAGVNAPSPHPDWDNAATWQDTASASRKGGPIQRFAKGGIPSRPTLSRSAMRYDAGGPSANTGLGGSADAGGGNYGWGGGGAFQPAAPTAAGTPTALGYQIQQEMDTLQYPGGAPPGRAYSYGANLDAMTPDQRTWMQNARTDELQMAGLPSSVQQLIYNQLGPPPPTKPAAATPAPAPVAPTPTIINPPSVQNITNYPPAINDPTTTTTTGAPGLPTQGVKAKSYDPNVDAQTGAGFANTANAGGTNYSVGSNDLLKQSSPGTISGTPNQQILSRKGGPIQRFANGGIPSRPTMKFADAGVVPFTTQGYQGSRTPGEQYYFSPDYIGPTFNGWAGTPESQLAPNQQAWAQTTQGLLGQVKAGGAQDASYWGGGGQSMSGPVDTSQIFNQMTVMPNPIWPSTPSAPTPLNEPAPSATNITNVPTPIAELDPTATTTTGIPGVPNIVKAKSYDPNVDAQTGASFANTSNAGGTNYAVGANDLLNQTTPGQISGNQQILSRKGGPLPKRVSQRYADGGGVDQSGDVSASALGMPPGLGQGGAQAIPPYYYNPATYAGAGAPVGKGVTQTSVPVYKAGAIPTLPMMRGGVVAFDDGGGVAPVDDTGGLQNTMYTDSMADERDDAQDKQDMAEDKAAMRPAPVPGQQPGFSGYFDPTTDAATPQPPVAGGGGGGQTQGPSQGPPPGLPASTPEVKDADGNPSRGFIAALTGGLHWLGEHLGLIGGAQAHPAIATDSQVQQNRLDHVNKVNMITPEQRKEINNQADPDQVLTPFFRNMAGMEYAYKQLLSLGRDADANKMAASILHYDQSVSQAHSEEAAKLLYDGHTKEAVEEINRASDALTDGRHIHAELQPDGNVKITGSDLNGREIWKQIAAPYAMLSQVEGMRNGSMQWQAYESQAAKYDRTFSDMVKMRNVNRVQADKEAAANQASEAEGAVLKRMYPPPSGDTAPPTAPTTPPPALTPVSTPALPGPGPAPSPGKSSDTTTAQTAAPPPDSDSSLLARGPTGHGGALPAQAGPNIGAAEAQPVSFEAISARLNQQEQATYVANQQKIEAEYIDPKTGAWRAQGPPVPQYPATMPEFSHLPVQRQNAIMTDYGKAVTDRKNWESQQRSEMKQRLDAANKQTQEMYVSQRAAASQQAAADRAAQSQAHADTAAMTRQKGQQTFETQKEADAHKYATVRALTEGELTQKFGFGKGGEDANIMTDYLGRGLLSPDDYATVAKAASVAGADPNTMRARLSQDYSPAEQNTVWEAIYGSGKYTHDVDPNTASELIGGLVKGYYKAQPMPMPAVDDGVPRVMMPITRQDGSMVSLVMPEQTARNLARMSDARALMRQQQVDKETARKAGQQKEWDESAPVRQQLNQPGGRFDVTPPPPTMPPSAQAPW